MPLWGDLLCAILPVSAMAWLVSRDTAKLHAWLRDGRGVALPSLSLPPLRRLASALPVPVPQIIPVSTPASLPPPAPQPTLNEAIISRLPDPLLIITPDRQVLRSNPAARLAFGREIGALLRHPLLASAIDDVLATGDAQTTELLLPVPTQRDIAATVIMLNPESRADERPELLLVLADRSRERATERMRADFVANASHELRSPLSSVIGFIETLRGPAANDPAAQERFLKIMAEQAWRMNRLIEDLLSLAQIEIGEHRPPDGIVDLAALARGTLEAAAPSLQSARITGVLDVAPDTQTIVGDADQLTQVLRNLVDNGIKYGKPEGILRIVVRPAVPSDDGPASSGSVIAVSDSGAGIAAKHLPRLTERFYRVDAGRSRAVGGTGLGLAIVKHIVQRHRGRLRIESVEGSGTTVSVWLPVSTPA